MVASNFAQGTHLSHLATWLWQPITDIHITREQGVWRVGDKVVSRSEARAEAARGRGRPAGSGTKVSTTIRFDADVLAAFKATGDGWQTRINDVLKEWLRNR